MVDVVPWAALVAAVVAIAIAVSERIAGARSRRREAYSRAYQAVRAWIEGLYRVRRRSEADEERRELVNRFHDMQEQLDFHRGWLASESTSLANAYDDYAQVVKRACKRSIDDAWSDGPRPQAEWTREDDVHPNENDRVVEAETAFLKAVRRHLSWWLLPRLVVWWKHRQPTPDPTDREEPQ